MIGSQNTGIQSKRHHDVSSSNVDRKCARDPTDTGERSHRVPLAPETQNNGNSLMDVDCPRNNTSRGAKAKTLIDRLMTSGPRKPERPACVFQLRFHVKNIASDHFLSKNLILDWHSR